MEVSDLEPAPRLVVNMINDLTVKCNSNADGCPAVVAFHELASHLKQCQYYGCKCGFKDSEDHNCVDYLLNKNKLLNKEMEELRKGLSNL